VIGTNSAGVTHRAHDADARRFDQLGGKVESLATQKNSPPQAVRAMLAGENTITAPGFTSCMASAPVLKLARLLIRAGYDPRTPLHIYRDKTLALKVRTIGEAAGLQVNGKGSGFKRAPEAVAIASPMRQNGERHPAPTPGIDGSAA
jgi:hypothetical protein